MNAGASHTITITKGVTCRSRAVRQQRLPAESLAPSLGKKLEGSDLVHLDVLGDLIRIKRPYWAG